MYEAIQMYHDHSPNHNINKNQHIKNGLNSFNTSINLESLSPKQLLCECIDLATQVFKEVIDHYIKVNNLENPFINKKTDLALLLNYILEPNRLDKVIGEFCQGSDLSEKQLARSYIFELKSLRNYWAHSQKINYKMASRGFDTLTLLFESFGGDQYSELYQKIQFYRKSLLIAQAKSFV